MIIAGLLLTLSCPGAATAVAAAAPVPAVDGKKNTMQKVDKAATPARAPDAALLDYLGRYGGAADGVDPLGLALPDEAGTARSKDPEEQP